MGVAIVQPIVKKINKQEEQTITDLQLAVAALAAQVAAGNTTTETITK